MEWLSQASIEKTRHELKDLVDCTPVWPLRHLSADLNINISMKLELFQRTGTFKARGAFNVMRQLTKEQLTRGVTTVSGGNHAVTVSYVAQTLGTSAKVVMPQTANARRRELCLKYGAEVLIVPNIQTAFTRVAEIEKDEGRYFVHPFEGPYTILGTATVGLEICEQLPTIDAVVVPIGGGGLCAGIASAIKLFKPGCKVYGVEPEGSDVMHRSFATGKIERLSAIKSIADSLGAPMTGPLCLELCQRYVDKLVKISDQEMREAMRVLFLEAKLGVEPAGAAALAAILGPLRQELIGKNMAIVVCGTNIDIVSYTKLVGLETSLQQT